MLGRSETDELAWIFAIAKAEGAISNRSADTRDLSQRLRDQMPSPEVRFHLADFVERHKFEFIERQRPPRAKQRLRQWAADHNAGLAASLRSNSPSRSDSLRLAVLLRKLKLEKVRGRPKVASYFLTDVDTKLKIAAEEYRVQLWLGVGREDALKTAADKHGVTIEGLRASVEGRSSKRRR